MTAKTQPHLREALQWLLAVKPGSAISTLTLDALEEMNCPYWKSPCGSLVRATEPPPLLLSFSSLGADKSLFGKGGNTKSSVCWGLGRTPTLVGRSSPGFCSVTVLPAELTSASALAGQQGMCWPHSEPWELVWSLRPWWSSVSSASFGSAPGRPGFQ